MVMLASPKMVEQVYKASDETPHMNALKMKVDGDDPVLFTYAALKRQIDAFGNGLISGQFKPGHKIVIWAKDGAESVVAQAGAIRAGLSVLCLPQDSSPADLAQALEGARALLISPTMLPEKQVLKTVLTVLPEIRTPQPLRVYHAPQCVESGRFPDLRYVFNTGFEREYHMVKFAQLLYYQQTTPYVKPLVSGVSEMGSVSFAGSGATELELPYFDQDAKTAPVNPDEDDLIGLS
jgi:acyl-CoA synthetase (AMP-forming)/AMP-acid ligase II